MTNALTQAPLYPTGSVDSLNTPPALEAISSHALLAGRPYVLIEHGGALYWLRATRSGKLILTK